MNWMECFETYKYRSIYTTRDVDKQDIDLDFFLDDDCVFTELREIYITGKRRQEQPAVYGEMKKHIPCRQGSSVLS